MPILDKNLLLSEIKDRLDDYIAANTVKRIIADASAAMSNYEVTRLKPDGGIDDESEQLIDLFLNAKEIEGRSEKTTARYRYILKKLRDGTNIPLKLMTTNNIREYLAKELKRGVSQSTIRGNVWVYNSFYGWLFNDGMIPLNPTANLSKIKVKIEKETPFTGEQIQLLKESAENECELAIIHFLLSTGCRISEACSVNREDIDYANLKLDVLGKGNKVRTVYIDGVTSLILKRYLSTRDDIDPSLFYSRRSNSRYTDNGIRAMLNRVGERACVPNVHPHRFRRTLATNLIDHGMSVQEVAQILGHSNLDTTMGYITINEKNTENAYRKYACM